MLKIDQVRNDFHCLKINKGQSPIYFDNACMTLKPDSVLNSMMDYYLNHPSCHKRAVHKFGQLTTNKYRKAREICKKFINSNKAEEIIFTRNTTEGINFLSNSFDFKKGDVVLTSDCEHNSNLLPWLVQTKKTGIIHKTFSILPNNNLESLEEFENILKEGNVKLVSVFHTSHVTGITLPINEMVKLAHKYGALFLLDAAQGIAHYPIDVKNSDIDFLVFSFHKIFGPTGMGAFYGKMEHLKNLSPFLVGGETVEDADYNSCTYSAIPEKFEAGLQNYAGVIGSGSAMEYIENIGYNNIHNHEYELNKYITNELSGFSNIKILGPQDPALRGSIFNFNIENLDSGELSIMLDKTKNIMVRSGVHCCHAWFKKYRILPSLRISLSIYNNINECEIFVNTLKNFLKFYRV